MSQTSDPNGADAAAPAPPRAFAYRAQTLGGDAVAGTIDAASHDAAQRTLEAMQLRVVELADARPPERTRPVAGDDFLSFNQQLAYLTKSGLPIERGLRLIAQETRSPGMAATIRAIADDAERGRPLGEAFAARRGSFPPLYGLLVDAGVRANNLPGMLFNLGRHMESVYRQRSAVWRAIAYPLTVLAVFAGVLLMLGVFVLPAFQKIFDDFGTLLPTPTRILMDAVPLVPYLAAGIVAVLIGWPLIWRALQMAGRDQFVVDALVLPLPLIGPAVRRNFIARWCDAVRLGVEGGLDLPASIKLAGDAIGSPSLTSDGEKLTAALLSGRPMTEAGSLSVLTETVTTSIDLASQRGGLGSTLDTLSRMYQEQAEHRLGVMTALLTPIMFALLGTLFLFVVAALFLPLVKGIKALT